MHTICLINQKGGCGKSSSCFHLAGALAKLNLNVLLIDADPQGSLSQGFLGSSFVEAMPKSQTLATVFDDSVYCSDFQNLVVKTDVEGISLLPTNHYLAAHNVPTPEDQGLLQFAIKEVVDELTGFDIVLIDCPPNLYLCSWSAMIAATRVLIPVPPEDFGTQGLRTVHQSVEHARQLNPDLRRLGHLISRFDRRLLIHRSYVNQLREIYKEMVLATTIPEASAFKVALTAKLPVSHHSPKSKAAISMIELAQEIFAKLQTTEKNEKKRVA